MEEEVTEPDLLTGGGEAGRGAEAGRGTRTEVNGELPGTPCLREVMECPMEPVVLQYPTENTQYG